MTQNLLAPCFNFIDLRAGALDQGHKTLVHARKINPRQDFTYQPDFFIGALML